jgi:CheY-like chemotaxis protein
LALSTATVPKTILIVDDDHECAHTLAILVRLHGHTALIAYDAASGLEMAQRVRPEIIFHHFGMPVDGAYAAALNIRRHEHFKGTLVVAVTAYDSPYEPERSKLAGYNLHIAKPIQVAKLHEILDSKVA